MLLSYNRVVLAKKFILPLSEYFTSGLGVTSGDLILVLEKVVSETIMMKVQIIYLYFIFLSNIKSDCYVTFRCKIFCLLSILFCQILFVNLLKPQVVIKPVISGVLFSNLYGFCIIITF